MTSLATATTASVDSDLGQNSLKVGEVYEVAVLSIDLAGHTEFLEAYGMDQSRPIITNYRKLVYGCLDSYKGEQWQWAGDGGLYAFWGKRRCERAALAGIQLVHDLSIFNLDRTRNPPGIPLQIRIAGGAGTITYREPPGEMIDLVINDTVKLQQNRTRKGEFVITEDLYGNLDGILRSAFPYGHPYRGTLIYPYMQKPAQNGPSDATLYKLVTKLQEHVDAIHVQCQSAKNSGIDNTAASRLHAEVKGCYIDLDRFRKWFYSIDSRWSKSYFRYLIQTTKRLQELEKTLWTGVLQIRPGDDSKTEVRLLKESARAGHAEVEFALHELQEKLTIEAGDKVAATGLLDRITALIKADETDQLTAFVAIAEWDRREVLTFLREEHAHVEREMFVKRLWDFADLVLIEDRAYRRRGGAKDEILFRALLQNKSMGRRFAVIKHFLGRVQAIGHFIEKQLEESGLEPNAHNLAIVWRALVAGHPTPGNRYEAATSAKLDYLWQTVAYPKTELLSLWVIAQRLQEGESEDLKKIFFDCVRSRLQNQLENTESARELGTIGKILNYFLEFDFFLEERYYRDLDALLTSFTARLVRFGNEVHLEKNLKMALDRERSKALRRKHTIPQGVELLPKAVQRHLAADGAYVGLFACHMDDRIAMETVRYINNETLGEVAKYVVQTGSAVNRNLKRQFTEKDRDIFGQKIVAAQNAAQARRKITALERELGRKLSKHEIETIKRRLGGKT